MKFIRAMRDARFLAGALCGAVFMAAVGAAVVWWKPHPDQWWLSDPVADDWIPVDPRYDTCLAKTGSKVRCGALMRIIAREEAAETAMKKEAATLLAAGFSKREVVKWAIERGFVGSQLSDAVGISLRELQEGKY